jgi:hypothetical protein
MSAGRPNAFAPRIHGCFRGSDCRLMELMTDDELGRVIAHETGEISRPDCLDCRYPAALATTVGPRFMTRQPDGRAAPMPERVAFIDACPSSLASPPEGVCRRRRRIKMVGILWADSASRNSAPNKTHTMDARLQPPVHRCPAYRRRFFTACSVPPLPTASPFCGTWVGVGRQAEITGIQQNFPTMGLRQVCFPWLCL